MSDELEVHEEEKESTMIYYIIGAIVMVAVVVAGYMLRPKPATVEVPSVTSTPAPTPTPGPITGLACESQYYNPVIGFPKYYISADGVDLVDAKTVDCEFTISIGTTVAATDSVKGTFTAVATRGGNAFHCATKALELQRNTMTKVEVKMKDDLNRTTDCSKTFLLP